MLVLIHRLRGQREVISALVRKIFTIATQLSAFDLRLSAASERMGSTSKDLAAATTAINASMGETSSAISEIALSTITSPPR